MSLTSTSDAPQLRAHILQLEQERGRALRGRRTDEAAVLAQAVTADLVALATATGQHVEELRAQLCPAGAPARPRLRFLLAGF